MTQPLEMFDIPDDAVDEVAAAIYALDPDGSRWATVVRHTYDMIYNGAETGRYRWDELMKTEKTHFGTLFEINAQREFAFEGGKETDFRIAGHQVDAKWSQKLGGWMLPPEVFDEIALVATGNDEKAQWSLGLVRIREQFRREGGNRDKKSQLNEAGRSAVKWLWKDAPMSASVLLQLPRDVVDNIFDHRAGTQRVDRLFRSAEGRLVHRNIVRTVAMQLDDQKRARGNGGSRTSLAPEGYLILSGAYYADFARQLGVPIPSPVEYISVRVVPSEDESGALLGGRRWRRARPIEIVTESAPLLPQRGNRGN
jgi:hypothetical protein